MLAYLLLWIAVIVVAAMVYQLIQVSVKEGEIVYAISIIIVGSIVLHLLLMAIFGGLS